MAALSRTFASEAHRLEFLAWWAVPPQPEWGNHYQEMFYTWPESGKATGVERGIPALVALQTGNRVLDLCCGDGYYPRWFYRAKAREIVAVDFDPDVIAYAKSYNAADNICYDVADIRAKLPDGPFDLVSWNVAIEHFTEAEISDILERLKVRMEPRAVLAGATIAEEAGREKQQTHHEYEFTSKKDLVRLLAPHFRNVLVWESRWNPPHNLQFWASDGMLPLDEQSPIVATARR